MIVRWGLHADRGMTIQGYMVKRNDVTVYRYTQAAIELDCTMASDAKYAAAYLAIYGEEWVPLCERHGDDGFGMVGVEVDAAFTRITDPSMSAARMADAGKTGIV